VRDSAIGEDENRSDGVDMLLDLSCNTLLVELILLKTASVGQAWCVEDANLGKRLGLLTAFRHAGTYHYAVLARKFAKVGRVGLALVVRTMLLVGVVEGIEVVVVDVIAVKDIGDKFQDRGLSNASLPNKKDGIWPIRLVLGCFDDPLLKGLYVARKYCQS